MKQDYSPYAFALLVAAAAVFTIGVQGGRANPNNFGLALLILLSVFITGCAIGRTTVSRHDTRFVEVAWIAAIGTCALSFGFNIGFYASDYISSVEAFVGGVTTTAFAFLIGCIAGSTIKLKVRKYRR